MDRPRIIHVSGDFPDPFDQSKTKVIRSLIDLTADQFEHQVFSINRVAIGFPEIFRASLPGAPINIAVQDFEYGAAVRYHAPARGAFHVTFLHRLGDWIANHLWSMERKPDLIVGHKLTIEGIAVRRAALKLGVPYALSIQGDTDTKIMKARPDLIPELRKVLHGAATVFPFTPWAWERVIEKLAPPEAPHIMLPCPTDIDQPLPPVRGDGSIISVFHLKSHKRKNLSGMVRAIKLFEGDDTPPHLFVFGGGSDADRSACERVARGSSLIRLEGPLGRDGVRARMNAASAFLLPSLRETFGLVFIEALFAGLPVIYPKGTSIDGYFNGQPFAIAVEARDPVEIADAIRIAINGEHELKKELAAWHSSVDAKRFRREAIEANFARGLTIATQG